jgi:hypothetical protein
MGKTRGKVKENTKRMLPSSLHRPKRTIYFGEIIEEEK